MTISEYSLFKLHFLEHCTSIFIGNEGGNEGGKIVFLRYNQKYVHLREFYHSFSGVDI